MSRRPPPAASTPFADRTSRSLLWSVLIHVRSKIRSKAASMAALMLVGALLGTFISSSPALAQSAATAATSAAGSNPSLDQQALNLALSQGQVYVPSFLAAGKPLDDPAVKMLVTIFGSAWTSGASTGAATSSVIGQVVSMVVTFIFSAGMLLGGYNVFTGIWNTAHEGEILGKGWHTAWAPFRAVVASIFMAPLPSGFCLSQTLVLLAAVWGVAFANIGTSQVVTLMMGNGVPLTAPAVATAPSVVGDLARMMMCREMVIRHENAVAAMLQAEPPADGANPIDDGKELPLITVATSAVAQDDVTVAQQETVMSLGNAKLNLGSALASGGTTSMAAFCGQIVVAPSTAVADDTGFLHTLTSAASGGAYSNTFQTRLNLQKAILAAQVAALADTMMHAAADNSLPSPTSTPVFTDDALNKSVLGQMATAVYLQAEEMTQPGLAYDAYQGLTPDVRQAAAQAIGDLGAQYTMLQSFYAADLEARVGKAVATALQSQQANQDLAFYMQNMGWTGLSSFTSYIAHLNSMLLRAIEDTQPKITPPDLPTVATALDGGGVPVFATTLKDYTAFTSKLTTMMVLAAHQNPDGSTGVSDIPCKDSAFSTACAKSLADGSLFAAKMRAQLSYGGIIPYVAKAITGTGGDGPEVGGLLINLVDTGTIIIGVATAIFMVYIGAVGFGGASILASLPTIALSAAVSPMMTVVVLAVITLGATLAYVLPLMSSMSYAFGVIGWIILVIEMVVAAPIWALTHLKMGGEGFTGQASKEGYAALVHIFFRPILMVIGYLVGLALFEVAGGWVIRELLLSFGIGDGNNLSSMTGNIHMQSLDLFGMITFLAMLAFTVNTLAERCFHLCVVLPDRVLRMADIGQSGAEDDRHASQTRNMIMGFISRTGDAGHKSGLGAAGKELERRGGDTGRKTRATGAEAKGRDDKGGTGGGSIGS